MSHIETEDQRSDNQKINDCMERNKTVVYIPCDHKYCWDPDECTDETAEEQYTCGPSQTLSAAQDKCPKCGLVFTY